MDQAPPIQGNPTDELLRWLDELECADSYAGFTFSEWLRRKPVAAIQALKDEQAQSA